MARVEKLRHEHINAAVAAKAKSITGKDLFVSWLHQSRELRKLFRVADGVEIYTPKGNSKKHNGLIGYIGDTEIRIVPKSDPLDEWEIRIE